MKKIGFLGLGVMGLPMALNVLKKSGYPVLGFDVAQARLDQFAAAGGETTSDPVDIYKTCDVIMQMLPTHPIIINSIKQAVQYGKPGNIILDLDSTAPDIIQELYPEVEAAGMHLLDSPVSGGNPMAIAGTLAIMTGGDKAVFEEVKPLLECMGQSRLYRRVCQRQRHQAGEQHGRRRASWCAIAEGYAFAAKAGIDLQTTFEATRGGFAGGPAVRQQGAQDHPPGLRAGRAHRRPPEGHPATPSTIAHKLGVDTPADGCGPSMMMDWMDDNGYIDERPGRHWSSITRTRWA